MSIDFNKLQEELLLRKLSLVSLGIKNKGNIKMLSVGYLQNNFKINFVMDIPTNESEDSYKKEIQKALDEFKKEMDPLISKGFNYLKTLEESKNKNLLFEFKNLFSGALAEISINEVKKNNLSRSLKKIEKKISSLEKIIEEEKKLTVLLESLQLAEYHKYFPLARSLNRKIKLYIGPTNSGKTHQALNDLAKHSSGMYLSPLRLLAWEGKEELEKRGHKTSLITGEEKLIEDGAKFKAQTIETLNFNDIQDAALIDEIQMIYDEDRGWAWTQALMGAPCKEIILAGSPDAEPIVRTICELLGEELSVIKLKRFNPLEVTEITKISELNKIPEGSAFIAFSRKNVLNLKKIFNDNKKTASVIYGNLSPEVRREEARKFRDGETKYLIATDAIAMGLNLPISRIIFTSVEKFNGKEQVQLSSTEIKQIAGRAGRYGKVEKGEVSALDKKSLKYIENLMKSPDETNGFIYLKPSWSHVQTISAETKSDNLFTILTFFTNKIMNKVDKFYVCTNLDQQKALALMLDKLPLSLEDKFLFSTAPVPGDDHNHIFINWIKKYSQGQKIYAPSINILNPRDFFNEKQLILENFVKLLNLYSWLCYKKPDHFQELDRCLTLREESNNAIEALLSSK